MNFEEAVIAKLKAEVERLKNAYIDVCNSESKLKAERDEVVNMVRAMYNKLPKEKHDYSGVGWCAGCDAVLYCGDGRGRDKCKPDCILQLVRAFLARVEIL